MQLLLLPCIFTRLRHRCGGAVPWPKSRGLQLVRGGGDTGDVPGSELRVSW